MTTRKNKWEGWKSAKKPALSDVPGNYKLDLSIPDSNLTRRRILQQSAYASLLLAFPWADGAFAAAAPAIPKIPYTKNTNGDGIIGPYGEVSIYNVGGQVLPVKITANNGCAVMDFSGRSPFFRFGRATDLKAITISNLGVQFGSAAKPAKWSATVVSELIKALVADSSKRIGAMQLRSALFTSYPVACQQLQPKYSIGKKMGAVMTRAAAGLGAQVMNPSTGGCTVTTWIDTVTRTITDIVPVIESVAQQVQACYDAQIAGPCKSSIWPACCAAVNCAWDAFTDLVTGYITIVTTIVEEVTREAIVCTSIPVNTWPNPWNPLPSITAGAVAQPKQQWDINGALNFLKGQLQALGPWFKCFLDGTWELKSIDTPLNIGGKVVIPYGVKVCLSTACAQQLSLQGQCLELISNWITLLQALAALSPEFALKAAPFGIVPLAALAGIAASQNPVLLGTAVAILAFIILCEWYALTIAAQLTAWLAVGAGNDGKVCIEHPTFALAALTIVLFGVAGGQSLPYLVPPIVTG